MQSARLKWCNMKDQKGFSLMEIAMVVLIMGVIALFAVPNLQNWVQVYYLNGDLDACRNLIRYAQQATITEQVPYTVQFYDLSSNPPSPYVINSAIVYKMVKGSKVVTQQYVFPQAYMILTEFSGDSIVFYVNGSCSGNGRIEFTQNSDGSGLAKGVQVFSATGKVQVQDPWQ